MTALRRKLEVTIVLTAIIIGAVFASKVVAAYKQAANPWKLYLRLGAAAYRGNYEATASALRDGADANGLPFSVQTEGSSPISAAAESGRSDVIELLLRHGASVNLIDGWGMTALSSSTIYDHPDIVKLLLSKGAQLFDGPDGHSPALLYAVEQGRFRVLSVILSSLSLQELKLVQFDDLTAEAKRYGQVSVTSLLNTYKALSSVSAKSSKWSVSPVCFRLAHCPI